MVDAVLLLRLHGICTGIDAAFEHQFAAFQFRFGHGIIVSRPLVGDGQLLRRAPHDIVGQDHRVFRFLVPAVLQPQHVLRLAEERGVVDDLAPISIIGLVKLPPTLLPLARIAFQLELDVMGGGWIREIHPSFIEPLFGAAEIHDDIRQRLLIHGSDRYVERVLPSAHIETTFGVLFVERALGDGDQLAVAKVIGSGGEIRIILYGGCSIAVFVAQVFRIIRDFVIV